MTAERLRQLACILNIPPLELLSDKEPVIHFSETFSSSPNTGGHTEREQQWKEMIESTKQLYGQVICGKDERIASLENELQSLRRERDKILQLVEKLTARN